MLREFLFAVRGAGVQASAGFALSGVYAGTCFSLGGGACSNLESGTASDWSP